MLDEVTPHHWGVAVTVTPMMQARPETAMAVLACKSMDQLIVLLSGVA
jgi:hypothetical protein